MQQSSFIGKLSQPIEIDKTRLVMIRKTYLLLFLSVFGMMIGGKIAMNSPVILGLFRGFLGWILAMVALNAVPMIAVRVRHNPSLSTLALFGNGVIAGIVIGPMLYMAEKFGANGIIGTAAWMTTFVFLVVTALVYTSGRRWAPSRNLMLGLFITIIGGIILNIFFQVPMLTVLVSLAVGYFWGSCLSSNHFRNPHRYSC